MRRKFLLRSAVSGLFYLTTLFVSKDSLGAVRHSMAPGGNWSLTSSWLEGAVPVAGDSVVITSTGPITMTGNSFAQSVNIQSGATLTLSSNTLNLTGSLQVDGTLTGPSPVSMNGSNMFIGGASVINNAGYYTITGTLTIKPGTTIVTANSIYVSANTTITNQGSVTTTGVYGNVTFNASTSGWVNASGSSLTLSNPISGVANGQFDPSGVPNTVTFSTYASYIYPAVSSYNNIVITGSATKSLQANTLVTGNFTLGSTENFRGNGFTLTLQGNWTDNNSSTTNLTNVNINFTGSGTQTISKASNTMEVFGNVNVNCTGTVLMATQVALVNLTITSGTLDVGASNNALTVVGNWSNTGGTFNPRSGQVCFGNSGSVTVGKTAGTETFYAVQKINPGTLTLTSNLHLGSNMILQAGTFAASNFTITLAGYWDNQGANFSPGTSTVIFNGNYPSVGKPPGTETFYNVTLSVGGSLAQRSAITCLGNLNITSGYLDPNTGNYPVSVQGNLTCTGSGYILCRTATVNLTGTSAQTVSTATPLTLYNLVLNNPAGATFTSGTYTISNSVTATSGTLTNSGATITIPSTSSKTAYVGSGAGSYAGTYIIQRYVAGRTANWQDFATPVSNTTLADWDNEMYISGVGGPDGTACCPTFYSVNTYDEPTETYVNVTSEVALSPMVGYEIWTADNQTTWNAKAIDTRGTPNSGNQTVNLTYTAGADAGDNRIGNPYASHITWNSSLGTNVQATIYVLQNGAYVGYGNGTDLPSHQGFLCYANSGGGSVTFTEACKNTNTGSSWGREPAPYDLSIKLSSPELTDYYQENFLNFDDNATLGFDNDIDAHFVRSPEKFAPSLCMIGGNMKLTRNHFSATANETVAIPLKAAVGIDGKYKLEVKGAYSMTQYSCALLEDLFAHKMIDVKNQPSYEYYAKASDSPDRFILHLSRKTTDCEKLMAQPKPADMFYTSNQVNIYPNYGNAIVYFDLDQAANATINVYNPLGQLVVNSQQVEAFRGATTIELPGDASGIYVVSVNLGNQIITKRILISRQ